MDAGLRENWPQVVRIAMESEVSLSDEDWTTEEFDGFQQESGAQMSADNNIDVDERMNDGATMSCTPASMLDIELLEPSRAEASEDFASEDEGSILLDEFLVHPLTLRTDLYSSFLLGVTRTGGVKTILIRPLLSNFYFHLYFSR